MTMLPQRRTSFGLVSTTTPTERSLHHNGGSGWAGDAVDSDGQRHCVATWGVHRNAHFELRDPFLEARRSSGVEHVSVLPADGDLYRQAQCSDNSVKRTGSSWWH